MKKRVALSVLIVLLSGLLAVMEPPVRACPREEWPKQTPTLEELIKLARSKNEAIREKAVGHLLSHLKPGMSREQVEEWLGPAARLTDGAVLGEENTLSALYYCQPPGAPGTQLMTVHYKKAGDKYVFWQVRGPHGPAN